MSGQGATRFEELIADYAGDARRSQLANYFADPYRFFAWARAEAPVLYIPEMDWWTVARYRDIRAVFQNFEVFSSANVRQPVTPLCPKAKALYESSGMRLEPALTDEEPQTHRRRRRIFSEGFSARQIGRYEPLIRMMVSREIDGFIDDGRADLLSQLFSPVASRVIFHMLGGADEDFDIANWPAGMPRADLLLNSTEVAQLSMIEVMTRLWFFGGKLVENAIKAPGDNYLGDVIRARGADPSLFTDNYLQNLVLVLQNAGTQNIGLTLANGIWAMLRDEAPWHRICADPGLIPNAVEEILRFGVSQIAFPRLATRDTEIGGRQLPAGSRILLLLASGNRDDSVFPDGETLDIDRRNAREHLSFGHGAHFCLGASLARLEMTILLEELTRRLPRMRLARPGAPDILRLFSLRGMRTLVVEWG